MRHTHIAVLFFLHISTLLLADEHDSRTVDQSWPGHNSMVVPEGAVTVQFKKIITHELDIVSYVWSIFMACNLDCLPGGQIFIDLSGTSLQLVFSILQLA